MIVRQIYFCEETDEVFHRAKKKGVRETAHAAGISAGYLSKWLNGRCSFPKKTVDKVYKALGL